MPNDALVARIKCPFFESIGASSITCNGICGAKLKILFKDVKERTHWAVNYCEKYSFEKCPIADSISNKYKEDER